MKDYKFYGHEYADVKPLDQSSKIMDLKDLYDLFSAIWTVDTCAPRMRKDWSEDNKTLGQCSITSFLVQDLFGGKVYGVPLGDGNYHCYNLIDDKIFDLTSEQFKGKLPYDLLHEQFREDHFSKQEKYERYLLLKERLKERIEN
ncbi:MAG: hypothetical protein IJI66_06550 [Erysipelotrichaceae bacterium]|nr:hypothetical protein [Erysipelotrichaceae bacterium]